MHITMTAPGIAALAVAMFVLAMVPSVSVLAVSARAASAGFLHGVAVALGIVTGDVVFIITAAFGLAVLTDAMGDAAFLIRYVAALFMIGMGIKLWRTVSAPADAEKPPRASSLLSSFLTGLLITLADQKAVLFYLGFLPAFVDLDAVSGADILILSAVTFVVVGVAKLIYVIAAQRTGRLIGADAGSLMNRLAGIVMLLVGFYLLKP
jgi:threonine/homoserine/homoserine lactone efflux protein